MQCHHYMTKKLSSFGDKKAKISELLKKNGFVDIIEKDIKNPKGTIGVSNKYVNYKAYILIVESPKETEGRGL